VLRPHPTPLNHLAKWQLENGREKDGLSRDIGKENWIKQKLKLDRQCPPFLQDYNNFKHIMDKDKGCGLCFYLPFISFHIRRRMGHQRKGRCLRPSHPDRIDRPIG
jgi:hypothetical protein